MERIDPDGHGDERTILTGWLDWQRATVRRKVEGLSEVDSYRSLLPTSPRMTIAGLVSHLRWTERGWFAASFPSAAEDKTLRRDEGGWEFPRTTLTELLDEYEAECALSRRVVARLELGTMQEFTPPQFTPVSVRWILTHMIDETARHLGHLDILREQLDGIRSY
ncbi:DinB family protein [Arthrobacter tecti]